MHNTIQQALICHSIQFGSILHTHTHTHTKHTLKYMHTHTHLHHVDAPVCQVLAQVWVQHHVILIIRVPAYTKIDTDLESMHTSLGQGTCIGLANFCRDFV